MLWTCRVKLSSIVFSLVCVLLFACPLTGVRGAPLEFQLSPKTKKHVALQPRADHHRIHFLVRAKGLTEQRCLARVSCNRDDDENLQNVWCSVSEVGFTPVGDDETFSVYLRTEKLLNHDASYRLDVFQAYQAGAPAPSDEHSLVYKWRVERDEAGRARVVAPKPDEIFTVVYIVSRHVPEIVNEVTEIRIVHETRTKEITVPTGFVFGVDTQSNDEDVFETVLSLSEGQ